MTTKRFDQFKTRSEIFAGIAQLVEQLICNQQVGGSSPSTGSTHIVGIMRITQPSDSLERQTLYAGLVFNG